MNFSVFIVVLFVVATFATLAFGIASMVKGGGKENSQLQNKIMGYRVWVQGATIILLVLLMATR